MILQARHHLGKIIGALLGLLLFAGPWGAFVGFLLGAIYDRQSRVADIWSELREGIDPVAHAEQSVFTMGVIVLSAKMAKCDGRITRAEIDAFKRIFNVARSQENAVGAIFDRARLSARGFEPYAARLAQVFRHRPAVLEEILSGLFLIGAADTAGLSQAEVVFLKQVAALFGFSNDDFFRMAARVGISAGEAPRPATPESYVVLGVAETATSAEIKKAYFSLIRKHHPDKLMAEGVPPEYIATATEKMKRINAAYDAICKMRGMT